MVLKLSEGALTVLERRYLDRDASGTVIETPEGMFRRVAHNISRAELCYGGADEAGRIEEAFYTMMASLEFLPNSPTLMNAGRRLQQLAACFVLPVEDSLDSIFESVKKTAIIHQSGGGTGFSFSRLRPSNDVVGSTGGVASGPVSFMRVFNAATEAIRQGGTRRGANMGVLRVDHPDILSFITAKDDRSELLNFNISVAITDGFMAAFDAGSTYPLVNPRTRLETGRLDAREVFGKIAECAWRSGEPGAIFIDRVNAANTTAHIGSFEATNPCGEQPLLAYEPCNLGSINAGAMLRRTGSAWVLDKEKLESTVRLAIRFLDDVIDMSRYPAPEIDSMARGNRRIGLGVMGFADMLARLRIPYASEEGIEAAESLMRIVSEAAWDESRALARARGPFPNIKGSAFDRPGIVPVRNATATTIAPTGTLSIIAGCSSGIEPFYLLSYTRHVLEGVSIQEVNQVIGEAAKEDGFYSDGLMAFITGGGEIKERADVPEQVKRLFKTAFEIDAGTHVRMQAAFQRHTDNAVSKTINLKPGSTVDDVKNAYLLAYRSGCKGVTVYRSGTRAGQVLTCRGQMIC